MRILTVLFSLGFCLVRSVAAQTVVKEGQFYVHENSKVSIQGEVINYGSIINQGILSVTGNWQNLSSYTTSAGTIALTGAGSQNFSHNGQTVSVLYIANPTTIQLADDVTVENKLVLREGVVFPGLESNLILAETAEIVGGAPNAYIHGRMYHTGAGRKFYPIGKNGHYAPVTLLQVAGENPVVGVEFYDQAVNTLAGDGILLKEFYWNISLLSGTFEGSPVALNVLPEIPTWEENQLVIAGSEHLDEIFKVLDKADVEMQGNRFIFSGSKFIRSQYITLGSPEDLTEMFYLPNVFSPSAPHPEDRTVKVYSKTIKPDRFQWTIWDNWGQVVYTTSSYEEAAATGWQGSHKGKGEALPGIYKFLLQGTFNSGQTFSKKGTIILFK